MSATRARDILETALIIALVLAIIGIIGGWFGAMTFVILSFFLAQPGPETLIDIILAILLLAPLEAAVIGGVTFILGLVIFFFLILDRLDIIDDRLLEYVIFLGIGTFTGLIGIPTAFFIHIFWIWYTTDSALDQILALLAEIRLALFEMLFVGFFSPILFLLTLLGGGLLIAGSTQLNRLRRLWPF